jgi:hypothetical protein
VTRQLTEEEAIARYGKPNQRGTYLRPVTLPFPLRVAWAPQTLVRRLNCHKLEGDRITAIFGDILAYYGPKRIRELGIDLFGGCFNYRRMKLHNAWSRHAWGIAIDLDPDRNGLHVDHTKAQFARPEYAPLIDAFESHGWINLGRRLDMDWMHFEAGYSVPDRNASAAPDDDNPFIAYG